MSTIFISYRREDSKSITGRINKNLCDTFKKENVFFDTSSISGGEQYLTKIQAEIATCKIQLVIIGPRWLTLTDKQGNRRIDNAEDLVRKEIEWALANENSSIIPVLVEGATMPDSNDLPDSIKSLNGLNVQPILDEPDYEYSIDKLNSLIKHRLDRKPPVPAKSIFSSASVRWLVLISLIGFVSVVVWRFAAKKPNTLGRKDPSSTAINNSLVSSKATSSTTAVSLPKLISNKTHTEPTGKQKKADYMKVLRDVQDKFIDLRTTVNQGEDYHDRYIKNARSCELLVTIYQNNVNMLTEINNLVNTLNRASSSVKKEISMQPELLVLKNHLTEWNRGFNQAYPDVTSMHGTGCEVNSKAGYFPDKFSDHLDEQILGLKTTMMFIK